MSSFFSHNNFNNQTLRGKQSQNNYKYNINYFLCFNKAKTLKFINDTILVISISFL